MEGASSRGERAEPSHSDLPDRCPRCAAPLSKDLEACSWTLGPFVRDSFSLIGTAIGGTASAFYGFNHGMQYIQRFVRGPMWLQFLIGVPPVMLFSSTCAGLAGGAVPALAQLTVSSYHTSFARSQSSLSELTNSREQQSMGTMPSKKNAQAHS